MAYATSVNNRLYITSIGSDESHKDGITMVARLVNYLRVDDICHILFSLGHFAEEVVSRSLDRLGLLAYNDICICTIHYHLHKEIQINPSYE